MVEGGDFFVPKQDGGAVPNLIYCGVLQSVQFYLF